MCVYVDANCDLKDGEFIKLLLISGLTAFDQKLFQLASGPFASYAEIRQGSAIFPSSCRPFTRLSLLVATLNDDYGIATY